MWCWFLPYKYNNKKASLSHQSDLKSFSSYFLKVMRRHLARLARRQLTATWAASSAIALLVSHGDPGLVSGCLLWPLLCWSPLETFSVLSLQRISPEENHKEINFKKKSWFVYDPLNSVIIKLTAEQRKNFPKSYNPITKKWSLISF